MMVMSLEVFLLGRLAIADTWCSWAPSRLAVWRTGPKEGVRCTILPFITTGRGQGSTCRVPDSGTRVLHHRVGVVVPSPAWLLGSVQTSLFGGKLEHRSVTPLPPRQVPKAEQHGEHNRTQTRPDMNCISGHNTCRYTTMCGTRTWQQLQRQTALQQTADSTAPRGCTDVAVSSLLPVLREEQAAQ